LLASDGLLQELIESKIFCLTAFWIYKYMCVCVIKREDKP
jgi:hypothetical protein